MKRELININNDDTWYKALRAHLDKYVKDSDTCKDSLSFPLGSTVAMHCEDEGPWIHAVIEEATNNDHRGRSYIIRVTKMDRLIMQNKRLMQSTPITVEQDL